MKNNILRILLLFYLVFIWNSGKAQTDTIYSIIVAGHAYGAHAGTNMGLHPPFLEKLAENMDSTVAKVFLTGDIVNYSNAESWAQVEKELTELGLDACYVMGNHDNNSVGINVFQEKHGGTYYYFGYRNELYIVLNSTESDRSISNTQLQFLNDVLVNTDSNYSRVFIFFHEVIWNNAEKYRLVRSNKRSRYNEMIGHSNFWEEVIPLLTNMPDKKFYVFSGDVGGNPDAIAAFYDQWENVTLLSSGMGEVSDENYLKVDILPDTVLFTLIPLHNEVEMKSIIWYNVPETPKKIEGPTTIYPPQNDLIYHVSPVFNATSYHWNVNYGISGNSDSTSIFLNFDESFKSGEISVSSVNDGFGESEPLFCQIKGDSLTENHQVENHSEFTIRQNPQSFQIRINSNESAKAQLRIYNQTGYLLFTDEYILKAGLNTKTINKSLKLKGFLIFELTTGNKRMVQKNIQY